MLDFWEDGDTVRINLSKRFYTHVKKEELEAIAPFKVERHTLTFDC